MRLLAQSQKDLSVISAIVQDAITRVGDISYDKKSRQLIIAMNRFCWENGKRSVPARARAALQISDVISVRQTGIASAKRNGILSLLDIEFAADQENPPSGEITINFSDNGTMIISVECLDLALVDVSGAWGAKSRPKHG
ncbi:MAG: DUF2948 family protein [Robiginitomaculum sp.]|nr:DUF2948 family protein [Robiginitomaculum sp.]